MQLADIYGSIRRHWRVSVAMILLSGIGVGLFLFTRKQVRGEDRWKSSVLLLVPTRGKGGTLPGGVPPELLQGQAQLALDSKTITSALDNAKLRGDDRHNVTFGFATNFDRERHDRRRQQQLVRWARRHPHAHGHGADRGERRQPGPGLRRRVPHPAEPGRRRGPARRAAGRPLPRSTCSSGASTTSTGSWRRPIPRSSRSSAPRMPPVATDQQEAGINAGPDVPIDTVLLAYEHRALLNKILTARQTYADNSVGSLTPSAFATVVERPNPIQIVPELPSSITPLAVALGLGLLLAIGVPVLMDVLDRTIREPRSAVRALGAPVLSTLPIEYPADLTQLAVPGSSLDAAYRALATTSVATDQLPRAIVVTSPVGEAQDSVAANFAAALAELGLDVALVPTSARQAWFADATSSQGAPTLTEMLTVAHSGRLNGQIREHLVPSRLANLRVLAPSEVESDDLLERLPQLFEGLASAGVDVTVIAGPSLLEDPSATIFAWSTRSVLWVIEAGEVTDQEAREAASRLELAGASPFGVAMISEQS